MGQSDSRVHRSRPDCVHGTVVDVTSLLDRRDFLKLSAATGVASILGCSRAPDSGSTQASAPAAGPESAVASTAAATASTADPVADKAASLGHDMERIFRFVQEEVRYEPYAGVLRGAIGTLAGRAGNSADQAVLLAKLLEASNIRHRFSIGPLADAKVRELDAASASDLATARSDVLKALVADAKSLGAKAGAAPRSPTLGSNSNPDKYFIAVPVIRETASRQFQVAIDTITSALAKAKVEVTSSWSSVPKLERERHIWVQAESGSAWKDLDPSFPGAAIGDTHTTAVAAVDILPEDMRHRVEFIAIAETWVAGQLVQTPILRYSSFADDLAGVSICFTHVKSGDLHGLNLIGSVGGSARYNPVLEVGPRLFVGETSISFGGGSGGTFADALGGGGEASLAEGEATAEWLQVLLSSPGEDPTSTVRTVFDRVSNQVRDGGTMDPSAIPPVELVDLPDASGEFLACRTVFAFSVAGGPMSLLSLAQSPDPAALGPLSWLAHAYHHVRDALMADIALSHGVRTFLDSPGVACLTIESVAGSTELDTFAAFDIWHRRFGVLPISGLKTPYPPLMIAGVLSHVAERCVSLDGYSARATSSTAPASVGAIFEQAKSQSLAMRVLHGALPKELPYSREALSLLDLYLQAGAVVIVPERVSDGQSRTGWWLVNPANGWTEDRMDDGRGNALVEYIKTNLAVALRVTACLISITSTLATIYQYVANKLTNVSDTQNEVLTWVQMITGVAGLVSGAGCVNSKWIPGPPKPPPRLPYADWGNRAAVRSYY